MGSAHLMATHPIPQGDRRIRGTFFEAEGAGMRLLEFRHGIFPYVPCVGNVGSTVK